jgi:hypothetical protein
MINANGPRQASVRCAVATTFESHSSRGSCRTSAATPRRSERQRAASGSGRGPYMILYYITLYYIILYYNISYHIIYIYIYISPQAGLRAIVKRLSM